MTDNLSTQMRLNLVYTTRNANQVVSSAQRIDDAISHISMSAAEWDRGLGGAAKVVSRRLQELYNVSSKTARTMADNFRGSIVSSARANQTLDKALASAIGSLNGELAASERAGLSFTTLVDHAEEITNAFLRESGAEAQLTARTQELNARERERVEIANRVRSAFDTIATTDGELIARERELHQETVRTQGALERSREMLNRLATATRVAAQVDGQLVDATNRFFGVATSGTPILDRFQASLGRTVTEETELAAVENVATNTTTRHTRNTNQLDAATNRIINTLNRLNDALSTNITSLRRTASTSTNATTSVRNFGRATQSVSQDTQRLTSDLHQLPISFSTVSSLVSGLSAQLMSLRSTFSRVHTVLRSFVSYLIMGSHYIREWLSLSTEFAETNHLLYTTLIHSTGALSATKIAMSEVTDENRDLVVQLTDANDKLLDFGLLMENADYASLINHASSELIRFTDAMMLDPTSIRQVYSAFLGMGDAAGISGGRVIEMSQQMTQLATNLSSLWDIDIEDAATKLRSALAGNTRAARQLGLDMGRTAANAWLVKNGIDAEYNSLSLADRMTVQYALAMEGAAAAHDDLAKSALQPANMFRILGQQATKTARLFGNALFPVFTAFVPLVIVMVEALGKLAASLSAFFGRKLGKLYTDAKSQWTSYADNVRFTTRSISDELLDAEDDMNGLASSTSKAANAAKDFKKQLLGFDEINNLTETEESSPAGIGGGLGDSVIPDSILDDIAKMAEDFGNVRVQIEGAAEDIKKFINNSKFSPVLGALKQFKDRLFGITTPLTEGQKKMGRFREELGETVPTISHIDGQLDRLRDQWSRFLDLLGAEDGASFFADFILGVSDGIDRVQDFIDKLLDFGEKLKEIFGNGDENGNSFARTLGRLAVELSGLAALTPLLTPLATVGGAAGFGVGALKGKSVPDGGATSSNYREWARTKRVDDFSNAIFKREQSTRDLIARQQPRRAAIASGGKDISLFGNAIELESMDASLAAATRKTEKLTAGLHKAQAGLLDTGRAAGGLTEILEFMKHPIEAFSHMGILGKLNIVGTVITTIIGMIKNSPMLQGTLQTALGVIGDLLSSVFTAFELIDNALSPFYAILGDIVAVLLDGVIVVLEALAGIITWLNDNVLAPFSEFMLRVTDGLNNGFSEGATTVWDTITGWFTDILEWIKGFFGIHSPSTVFSDIGTNMMLGLDEGVEGEEEGTQNTFGTILSNLFDKIVTWLGEFIPTIPGKLLAFLETYVFPNIPTILNNIITFVVNLGADIIATIWAWILTLPQKIPEWLGIIWNKLNDVLGGWPAKVLQYGKDFIIGFWNGINEKVQWVKDKVSGAFSAIGDKVKKIFGIASPSKLMMEYGGYVSEGFELGVEQGIPSILATVGTLAADVSDLMATGVIDMGAIANSEMDNLNAALSTGIVANTQSTLDMNNNDMIGTMQMEIGLLREQNNLLSQILGKDVSVTLDGNQLATSINRASRVQGRPLIYA